MLQEYYILQLLPKYKKSHSKNSPAHFQVTPSSLPKTARGSFHTSTKETPKPIGRENGSESAGLPPRKPSAPTAPSARHAARSQHPARRQAAHAAPGRAQPPRSAAVQPAVTRQARSQSPAPASTRWPLNSPPATSCCF